MSRLVVGVVLVLGIVAAMAPRGDGSGDVDLEPKGISHADPSATVATCDLPAVFTGVGFALYGAEHVGEPTANGAALAYIESQGFAGFADRLHLESHSADTDTFVVTYPDQRPMLRITVRPSPAGGYQVAETWLAPC